MITITKNWHVTCTEKKKTNIIFDLEITYNGTLTVDVGAKYAYVEIGKQ